MDISGRAVSQGPLFLCFFRLAKSRQNERNLVHALKKPKSFTVAHVVPLFPKNPVLCERNMAISQNFHMSQVDGAATKKGMRRLSGLKQLESGKWKLLEWQEIRRSQLLGLLKDIHVDVLPSATSSQIRRRFVTARTLSFAQEDEQKHWSPLLGRTSQLLLQIERSHGKRDRSTTTAATTTRSSWKARSRESCVDCVFPLKIAFKNSAEDFAIGALPMAGALPTARMLEDSALNGSHRMADTTEPNTSVESLCTGPEHRSVSPRQTSEVIDSTLYHIQPKNGLGATSLHSLLAADLGDTKRTSPGSLPFQATSRTLLQNFKEKEDKLLTMFLFPTTQQNATPSSEIFDFHHKTILHALMAALMKTKTAWKRDKATMCLAERYYLTS